MEKFCCTSFRSPPPKVNILLVDDREDKLLALDAVLNKLGQNLVKARSGKDALRHLLKTEFGRRVHDLVKSGKGGEAYNAWGEVMFKRVDPLKGNDAIARSMSAIAASAKTLALAVLPAPNDCPALQ
jgi:CheY-like chemotaxis protein